MALADKIEAVNKVSKVLQGQAVAGVEAPERVAPNKEHFNSLLDKNQTHSATSSPSAIEKTNATSLMDEVKKLNGQVDRISKLTPEDLKSQANHLISQIDNVKEQLKTVQTDIKPSYQQLLRNRLTHIDENLKIALSKAGVESSSATASSTPVTAANGKNPIEKFLGYLTQGQYQLDHLHQTLDNMVLTNAQLTPANMIAIQLKVSQVQQEIELFTSLLNKALESTKTIMNVQV